MVLHTVRVDHRDDVKVVLVHRLPDALVPGAVVAQQPVRNVLGHHGGHPLPRVHGAVEDDGRLDARPRAAPDVDALDVPLLERLAGDEERRLVAVLVLELQQEPLVRRVRVVACEPVLVDVGDCRQVPSRVRLRIVPGGDVGVYLHFSFCPRSSSSVNSGSSDPSS